MNNPHGRCLITGCNFLDVEGRQWIHGDLHQLHDTLIFNANGCEWKRCIEDPLPAEEMAVLSPVFYEKNSQIVFPLAACQFNEAAHKYIGEQMRLEEKQIIVFGDGGIH